MAEKAIQIAYHNDLGDRTLCVLTDKGRVFCSIFNPEKRNAPPVKWVEVPLPIFGATFANEDTNDK